MCVCMLTGLCKMYKSNISFLFSAQNVLESAGCICVLGWENYSKRIQHFHTLDTQHTHIFWNRDWTLAKAVLEKLTARLLCTAQTLFCIKKNEKGKRKNKNKCGTSAVAYLWSVKHIIIPKYKIGPKFIPFIHVTPSNTHTILLNLLVCLSQFGLLLSVLFLMVKGGVHDATCLYILIFLT